MTKVLEIAGVLAVAVVIAAIDGPKFEFMKNSGRHKAVYYTILTAFVLVSVIRIWTGF